MVLILKMVGGYMKVFDMLNNFEEVYDEWKVGKSNYWISIDSEEIDTLKDIIELDEESIIECRNIRQISRINF